MIDLLRAELANSGYTVDQKVFAFGYSIGGHFSNRFSLLQPNRVKAFSAGGLSGLITLPITSYSNEDFYWYFGVSNFDALVGDTFNYSAYESIPQYYFWGENDLSPYHLDSYPVFRAIWGNDSAEALSNQCSFLQGEISNVVCTEYAGIGHEWTNQELIDVFDFFSQNQ